MVIVFASCSAAWWAGAEVADGAASTGHAQTKQCARNSTDDRVDVGWHGP